MNLNIAKAYLILLVIIDHNDLSRTFIGNFLEGFTFHVVGFFSLYYMSQNQLQTNYTRVCSKQVVRYLYPYTIFVVLLSTVMFFMKSPDFTYQAELTLKAIYSGNHIYLKQSTNMYLLWFLPAFISFVFLDKIYKSLVRVQPRLTPFSAFLLFVIIPFLPENIQNFLPMGLMTAGYILFLAITITFLHFKVQSLMNINIRIIVILLFFIIVKYLQIQLQLSQEIGFLKVTPITEPLAFMINALESIVGVLLIFSFAALPVNRFLNDMGKYSLQVYLFHAFIALLIYTVLESGFEQYGLMVWIVSIVLTAIGSTVVSKKVMQNKILLRYLFPKDYNALVSRTK